MTPSTVLTRIKAILTAVTTPTFELVQVGEPLSIPSGDRLAAVWYEANDTSFETLGDANVIDELAIRCYWRVQFTDANREAIEAEVWAANRAIRQGLRGDSQINGETTDLKIGRSTAGWAVIGNATFRALTVPVQLWVYESDTIAP